MLCPFVTMSWHSGQPETELAQTHLRQRNCSSPSLTAALCLADAPESHAHMSEAFVLQATGPTT